MTFNNRDKSSSGMLFSFQLPNGVFELDGNGDVISVEVCNKDKDVGTLAKI